MAVKPNRPIPVTPPPGTESGTPHWLIKPAAKPTIFVWHDGYWKFPGWGIKESPAALASMGWTYREPVES